MCKLADLVNDKNKLTWLFDDKLKEFCEKYQISPFDIEIKYSGTGLIISVKV